MAFLKKNVRRMDIWDIALIKWGVVAAVLFILTIWPALTDLVVSVNPWYFFVACIIIIARPIYRFYFK